jgi:hypothetical protein
MIKTISLSFHAFKEVQEISNTPPGIKHDLKGKGKQKALNQSSSQIEETQLGICKNHSFGGMQNVRAFEDTRCCRFEFTMAKWKKISRAMMDARFSHQYKNGHTCKIY